MNTHSQQNRLIKAIPLFLIMFIDGMGVSLLFPILNGVILDPSHSILAHSISNNARNIAYGVVLASFMLSWFIGAPILSGLSDRIGRKKSLQISLMGAIAGYLLSGLAVFFRMFSLLILGRIVSGLTSGNQPVAQAAMIDLSNDKNKAFYIALILLVLSVAIVAGPLIGGVLSDSHIVSWFNDTTPLYAVALLSLINFIMLSCFFRDRRPTKGRFTIKPMEAVHYFISAFKHPKVRYLSLIFLFSVLGWSAFFNYLDVFADHIFAFSTLQDALYMAVLGIGLTLGFGVLVKHAVKYFKHHHIVIVSASLCGIFIAITLLASSITALWVFAIPIAATNSLVYAVMITQFSNAVNEDQQGWVMGITGAIMPLAFAISSIVGGLLVDINVFVVMWFAVACLMVTSVLMFINQKKIL